MVGALLGAVLTQAAHAGGCRSQDAAHGPVAGRKLHDLVRCHLACLAPCGARQSGIEASFVPESGLGAADAAVSGLDRKAGAAVPFEGRASVVRGRPLAAEFVQAPAVACSLIVERLGKLSLIVEGPPVA